MKILVVDHTAAYMYVLNASTYTVRELSLAGMSRGFWLGTYLEFYLCNFNVYIHVYFNLV
jgi:hypothetical protein